MGYDVAMTEKTRKRLRYWGMVAATLLALVLLLAMGMNALTALVIIAIGYAVVFAVVYFRSQEQSKRNRP